MGLFGKKQQGDLIDSLAQLEEKRSQEQSGSVLRSSVSATPAAAKTVQFNNTHSNTDSQSTTKPVSVMGGAQINFADDIMTVNLNKSAGESATPTQAGESASTQPATTANSLSAAAQEHANKVDEFERMLAEYNANVAGQGVQKSDESAVQSASTFVASADPVVSSVAPSSSVFEATQPSLSVDSHVTQSSSVAGTTFVQSSEAESSAALESLSSATAKEVSSTTQSSQGSNNYSSFVVNSSVPVQESVESTTMVSQQQQSSSEPIVLAEEHVQPTGTAPASSDTDRVPDTTSLLAAKETDSATPASSSDSVVATSASVQTDEKQSVSTVDIDWLKTAMDDDAANQVKLPQESLDKLKDVVSVEAGKELVSSTITQQYNSVLEQNSLLVSQIEQLQLSNDGLFKQIHRWQEYRSEALNYINSINAKHEDDLANLKREQQRALDEIDEEWAAKFDEKSDQVDQKYQDFNNRVNSIVQNEQEEKAQLQDRITQLQKENIDTAGQVKTRDFRITELTTTIDDLKQKMSDLEKANSDVEEELGKKLVELNVTSGNLTDAMKRLEDAKHENDEWKTEIANAKSNAVADLETTQKNMNNLITDFNTRLSDAEKEHQFTKVKYSASLQRQQVLERNNADLTEQNKVLLSRIKKLEKQGTLTSSDVPSFGSDFPKF